MIDNQIVVCFDGAWDAEGYDCSESNVAQIGSCCLSEINTPRLIDCYKRNDIEARHQRESFDLQDKKPLVRFSGKIVTSGRFFNKIFGSSAGNELDENIRRAYRFISRHYTLGDRIFVFGFSKGAYCARSLVGFISELGLLRPECSTPEIEDAAWKLYRAPPDCRAPAIWRELRKSMFDPERSKISCLGIFDAVGTFGIPLRWPRRTNQARYNLHETGVASGCALNLHAVAIDEGRSHFEAMLWRTSHKAVEADTEQVWFPGGHLDVGGVGKPDPRWLGKTSLGDIALNWMLSRVRARYPEFPSSELARRGDTDEEFRAPQTTGRPRLQSYRSRSIGNEEFWNPGVSTEALLGFKRNLPAVGEGIHISAIERIGTEVLANSTRMIYAPKSLLAIVSACERAYHARTEPKTPIVDWSGAILTAFDRGDREAAIDIFRRVRCRLSNLK